MINFLLAVLLFSSNLYLPLIIGGGDSPGPSDTSAGDGTCLFWRQGNDVYLSIYVGSVQMLYVTTSSERDDEPYVIAISPKTIKIGEIDENGESLVGITHEVGNWDSIQIRCDAQFSYAQ